MAGRLGATIAHMFLRESRQKRVDGSVLAHLQLAESVWDADQGRSKTRIVYSFGRVDDPEVSTRLRKLARSILRRCSPEEIVADDPSWRVENAWPYGDVFALEQLWERLGLAEIVRRQAKRRKIRFDVERALFAMVENRALAPCSKLYCWEQWLAEDVRITGAENFELQHLYRAMDFLAENKDELEEAIFYRVSDPLNLEVDLIFYDTTSVHFEIDEEDAEDDDPRPVSEAGPSSGGSYPAPRKRGHSKNGRGDAPQVVVGL
jgi:hypothetical protein